MESSRPVGVLLALLVATALPAGPGRPGEGSRALQRSRTTDGAPSAGARQDVDRTELLSSLDAARRAQGAPGAILGVRAGAAAGSDPDPGAATTIAVATGEADVDSGRRMRTSDPFYLGSISKTFVATVVLQLVEEGRLALDGALAEQVPEFPAAGAVTIRQLLQHTSGLGDLAAWAYYRPSFAPGEGWAYSNTNYTLLALVVERATGETLVHELRARVFDPLAMEATWLQAWEEPRRSLTVTGYLGPVPSWPHSERFGELGPTTVIDAGNLEWGSGGIVSTADESLRFLDALLDGELLSGASLAAMRDFRPTPPLGGTASGRADLENGYGLGLVRTVRPGYEMIGHGGLYNGYNAGLWRISGCETSIALFVNRGFVDMRAIMDRVVDVLGCPDV